MILAAGIKRKREGSECPSRKRQKRERVGLSEGAEKRKEEREKRREQKEKRREYKQK